MTATNGTLTSVFADVNRRDSFITHRAFCDALAEESARVSAGKQGGGQPDTLMGAGTSSMSVMGAPSSPHGNNVGRMSGDPLASVVPLQSRPGMPHSMAGLSGLGEGNLSLLPPRWGQAPGSGPTTPGTGPRLSLWLGSDPGPGPPGAQHMQLLSGADGNSPFMMQPPKALGGSGLPGMMNALEYEVPQAPRPSSGLLPLGPSGAGSLFAHLFASGGGMPVLQGTGASQTGAGTGIGISGFSDFTAGPNRIERGSATAGLSSSSSAGMTNVSSSGNNGVVPPGSSLFNQQQQHTASAQMSATALLQKAAQMGATASNSSLLRGFGLGGADSSTMALWQGQRQEQGRAGDLPPNMSGLVHPLMRRPGEVQGVSQGMGSTPLGPGSTTNFAGGQGRPPDNTSGVPEYMSSLSGGAGLFGGPLDNMPSMFGPNATNMGGMMLSSINHRLSTNDVMGGHSQFPGGPVSQGMGPSSMLPGLGGSSRGENDGSDRFTRDFLGVGGAAPMTGGAAGMGRTLSQRDLASITSLGPGVDLGAFFNNQRENLRSVGASGHSPGKSWDAS